MKQHRHPAPEASPALFFPRLALAAGFAAGLASLLAGCARVEPIRTLPHWVRGVYVPIVRNASFEPGIEETATQLIQEEFLADGRVRIVPKDQADAMIEVRIADYRTRVDSLRGDHIPSDEEILIESEIQIRDPDDKAGSETAPIAKIGPLITRYIHPSDVRSTDVVIEPDARRNALAQLARQVVDQTINGFPAELRGATQGAPLPTAPSLPNDAGGHGQRQGTNFSR